MSAGAGRLARQFAAARARRRPAFIAYITVGDPSLAATLEVVAALERAGVDIVELGVPFSDPVIDGPVIQAASGRALAAGATLAATFDLVRAIRRRSELPLVLYSYLNPILRYGVAAASRTAADVGLDGMLTVDLPVGAAPEIIHEGINGYLCPAKDKAALSAALDRALEQKARWGSIGARARESAEAFDIPEVVEQYVTLLRELHG